MNNNNTIFGVSYDATGTVQHPVAWLRSEIKNDDGSPQFTTINLGLERIDATPQSVKEYNDSRLDSDLEKSTSIHVNRRQGQAQIASAATGDAAGILKPEETDTEFKPFYWPKVDNKGFDTPLEMLSPIEDGSGSYLPFFAPIAPTLTSIASRQISGWYTGGDGVVRSAEWLLIPQRDENNIVSDKLIPSLVPMLEAGNRGKVLHSNSNGETVGTAVVTTADNIANDHAYYHSSQCGIQDLNQLLSVPVDGTQRLTQAYRVASGLPPNPIISKGLNTNVNDPDKNYVLLPTDIYVNLKVDISADHDRLTVGDDHSYFITLTNNATNYATCVSFVLEAAVYTPNPDENGLPREELLAGLTFLRVESQADLSCDITPIRVTCHLDRLDPGGPVTVSVITSPRALLADRDIKASVRVTSTEAELQETLGDNSAFTVTSVDRRGCFIATAAYGSYLSPEVKGLRVFRDEVLLKTAPGQWLVDTYYDISPPYADYISQHDDLRTAARWALSPLVYLVLYPLPMTCGALFLLYLGFRLKNRSR